jgi:hypothetical protein
VNYDSLAWALIALVGIIALWDTFYRFFRMREQSGLSERMGKIEDEVAVFVEKAGRAEEYTRQIAGRVSAAEAAGNRWRRP